MSGKFSQGTGQDEGEAEVPMLRYLRALVTGLAVVMGVGILAIVAILWLRLGGGAPLPELPANIALPQGARVESLSFAKDWIVVVTEAGEILLYDRDGQLRDSAKTEGAGD